MWLLQLAEQLKTLKQVRNYHVSTAMLDEKAVKETTQVPNAKPNTTGGKPNPAILGPEYYYINKFDKFMLVWLKKFKSLDEVPKKVTHDFILKARSQARIKTANYMMVLTVIGCLAKVIYSKQEMKEGMTMDKWVQQTRDRYEK